MGTPADKKKKGSANLKYVFDVAKEIRNYINKFKIIVTKSTVPTGTVDLFTIILYLFVKFLPIEVAAFLTKLKSELPSDLGGVPTAIKYIFDL